MRVLFFAHLKEAAGCARMELRLAAPTDADGVWRSVISVHPRLALFRDSVRLARNGAYAAPDAVFDNADEVALIPPVSGG